MAVKMLFSCCLLLTLLAVNISTVRAQSVSNEEVVGPTPAILGDKVFRFPSRLLDKLTKKQASLGERLERQSLKYLNRLSKEEKKLQRQLAKVDSLKAQELFGHTTDKYRELTSKMGEVTSKDPGRLRGTYLPWLDSVKTSLKFLDKHPEFTNTSADIKEKLASATGSINQLQGRLKQSDAIKAYVTQRKEQIRQALSTYSKLPKGLSKQYSHFSKEVYYYQAQVQEYRNMLNDPSRMEQKSLELLNKLPAFKDFMQKNSMLASLFRVPSNYGSPEALAGLQTRAQVNALISSRISAGGANSVNIVQQNLQAAQSQLSQLKNKVNQLGGGSSELAMPDFKPNDQKTKTFLGRLEYGSNLQTTKSNSFFPTTSDIALSIGYKFNDNSTAGIGTSYKLGIGKNIRKISFTNEGIGLRTFMDYKLKGNFWITGGGEINYRRQFNSIAVLKTYSAWQQSALLGLSRKYQVSKKVKGNAQILYDFLWKQQVPKMQPIIFRVGYNLK